MIMVVFPYNSAVISVTFKYRDILRLIHGNILILILIESYGYVLVSRLLDGGNHIRIMCDRSSLCLNDIRQKKLCGLPKSDKRLILQIINRQII